MNTLESLVIFLPKDDINFILTGYPELSVIGYQMLEDGYELVIEGDTIAMGELVYELGEACESSF